jgi:hypothetical protein
MYVDRAKCRTDTYAEIDAAIRRSYSHGMFGEALSDRERNAENIREATGLALKDSLEKGVSLLSRTASKLIVQPSIHYDVPLPRAVRCQNFDAYGVPSSEDPSVYIIPLPNGKEYAIHTHEVLPTRWTSPGRSRFDAVINRQLELIAQGMQPRYNNTVMTNLCRYHNRRMAA